MPIPITARGAKMLKDELQRLKTQDRPAVVQAIAEAREKGDLSENAEYDAARESQAFIEGRILELESKIAQFQVIDPTTLPDNGKVVFSATVTIEDPLNLIKFEYQYYLFHIKQESMFDS